MAKGGNLIVYLQNEYKPSKGDSYDHFHVTFIQVNKDILPMTLGTDNNNSSNEYGVIMTACYFDGMAHYIFHFQVYIPTRTKNNHVQRKKNVQMELFMLNPLLNAH